MKRKWNLVYVKYLFYLHSFTRTYIHHSCELCACDAVQRSRMKWEMLFLFIRKCLKNKTLWYPSIHSPSPSHSFVNPIPIWDGCLQLTLECLRDIRVVSVGKTGIHWNSVDWWAAFILLTTEIGKEGSLNEIHLTVFQKDISPFPKLRVILRYVCVNKDIVSFHPVACKSTGKSRCLGFEFNSCSAIQHCMISRNRSY